MGIYMFYVDGFRYPGPNSSPYSFSASFGGESMTEEEAKTEADSIFRIENGKARSGEKVEMILVTRYGRLLKKYPEQNIECT